MPGKSAGTSLPTPFSEWSSARFACSSSRGGVNGAFDLTEQRLELQDSLKKLLVKP